MDRPSDIPAWNVFARREAADLCCAVPADAAVPRFLLSGDWAYGGRHAERAAPPGFQGGAAREGARINGFYLFQVLRAAA